MADDKPTCRYCGRRIRPGGQWADGRTRYVDDANGTDHDCGLSHQPAEPPDPDRPGPPLVGMQSMQWIESGVNEHLEPFLSVRTEGEADGRPVVLVGQLSPAEVRQHALGWLEAAEAAEQDSMVARELTEGFDLPYHAATQFVGALRARRNSK